jgi:hypothetical protein
MSTVNIVRKTTVTIEHPDYSEIAVSDPDNDGCIYIKQDNDTVMVDKEIAAALIEVLQEIFK